MEDFANMDNLSKAVVCVLIGVLIPGFIDIVHGLCKGVLYLKEKLRQNEAS